jgi:hypothetical protein
MVIHCHGHDASDLDRRLHRLAAEEVAGRAEESARGCQEGRARKELAPYEVNDKGTIRFRLTDPVPVTLIGRLAAFRLKQVIRSRA